MELFDRLTDTYTGYETRIESGNGKECFLIVNPFWDANISVSYEDGIIFRFCFQHAHFDGCDDMDKNIDSLVEYINTFLNDKQVAVEFFQGERNLFGGSRYLDDINISSGESMLRSFAGDNASLYDELHQHVKGLNCRCSIRGWSRAINKDIDFVL